MKKIIITVFISAAIGIGTGWLIFGNHFSSDPGKGEKKILYYRNPMNPTVTSPVPKKDEMGMDYVPVYEDQANSNTVRIDPVTQQNIGVTTEIVKKRKLSRNIRTTANITYDETKLYTINTKVMGYVEKLYIDYTGQLVKKGQPLLEIYSPDLVSTQEEYLQAVKYKNEISNGSAIGIKGADQLVQSAKRRLLYWDISEKEIQALEQNGTPQKTMTIYSPADGIVTDKMVINGQNVMPGMVLYKIADLSIVWGIAQIYQYELQWIKAGDKVDLQLSYLPGKSFKGKITYIYPYLDTEAKTVQVRIEIQNTDNYEFKPGMFADVTIKSPLTVETAAVPNQAIIHTGTRDIAIISLGNGYFKPVSVTLGAEGDGGYIQVIKGLNEGDNLVTSSQFLIDSESNLNAALNSMDQPDSVSNKEPEQNNSSEEVASQGENSSNNKSSMENMKMEKEPNQKSNVKGQNKNKDISDIIRKEPIDVKSIDSNKDGKVFEDIMDWNVLSDKPGVCPLCGMTLKEFTIEQAEKNLKEHGFKVK